MAETQNESLSAVRATRRAIFETWLASLFFAVFHGQSYFSHAPEGLGFGVHVFLQLALLTNLALLSAPIALLGSAATWLRLPSRICALFVALLVATFHLALLVDVRVYNLFRYHLNAWVWTVVTTEGVEDSIQLDLWFWTRILAFVLVIAAAAYAFQRWRSNQFERGSASRGWLRPGLVFGCVLVPAMLIEKSLYARADLTREREVPSLARLVPFYPRFTVKRFARKWFDYDLEERERVDVRSEGLVLRYPIERPRIAADGPRPNILVITVESLRADMLAPETMPRTFEFSRTARRFLDHASGGSTSRYGTFTLVYGLHGSYFAPIYAENISPVIVDSLIDLGYGFRIFGSASMSFPEMRSTAWVRIEDKVEDKLPRTPGESRDGELVRRFEGWMSERAKTSERSPFYCFAFIDAPHSAYNVVEERTPFQPYAKSLDFVELSGSAAREKAPEVFNRYRNSVVDADYSIGRMLDALAQSGEFANTLVVITGDHGEEFYEHGFWGHTSNYTRTQVLVPMVVSGPGVTPGDETRPTSHVDVAPTLLELLGADPTQRRQWCTGENMFDPPTNRHRVLAGWDTVAAWTEDAVLVMPLDPYRGSADLYDYDWKPVRDPDAALRAAAPVLRELSEVCRRFLR